MLTGKRFQLGRETIALDVVDGKRTVVALPVGATIKIVSGPVDSDRMIDISWQGRTLTMFAVDLDTRGTEIKDVSA
jgi:hypothetical protein